MFKRDQSYKGKIPLAIRPPTEAEVRALSDEEFKAMLDDFRRRHVLQKLKLYHRCPDRRCRRVRACTALEGRCICEHVPAMGRRERKRLKRELKPAAP